MRTPTIIAIASAGLLVSALLGGCGPGAGVVIRPAPTDQRLTETVIARDPGLFVTDKIAIIDVDGVIFNSRDAGLFSLGENPVSLFVEKLDKASADAKVRAIVLRINSPGGGVAATDIMHHRLQRFRAERDVPVIALIEDVGASGGYYLACGADEIVALPASITGSIGVMVQAFSVAGTMKMIGVSAEAVTSGEHKNMASPFEPLDPEDLAILQKMVDEFYEQFVAVVDASREDLSAERVRELADGRIYTGVQAADNGLVDRLGYMSDALAIAKQRSGASRVKVVMYHRPLGYRVNAYSQAPAAGPRAQTRINLLNVDLSDAMDLNRPRFMYLWTGRTSGR